MIRSGLLLAVLILAPFCVMGQSGHGVFDEVEYDFGRIDERGGEVSYTFWFTNTGDTPLVVQGVSTSCGCTASEWSNAPVLPGQRASITATYNPLGRPGGFMKSISVRTNGNPADYVLHIKGVVTPRTQSPEQQYPLRYGEVGLRSSHVSIGQVWKDGSKSERVSLYNFGDRDVTVRFSNLPSHVSVSPSQLRLAPHSLGEVRLEVNGTKSDDWGLVTQVLRVDAGGAGGDLTLVYSLEENFALLSDAEYASSARISMDGTEMHLGEVKRGEVKSGRIKLSNLGQRPLQIRKVSSSCDCVQVKALAQPVAAGKSADLEFSFSSDATGTANVELTVISNDPTRSVSIVKVSAEVR